MIQWDEKKRDEFFRNRAKEEIFAYLKEGLQPGTIERALFQKASDGGIYDFYSPSSGLEKIAFIRDGMTDGGDRDAEIQKLERELREISYKIDVGSALLAIDALQDKGFSRTKIIGMLQNVPLEKWEKELGRIVPESKEKSGE